MKRKENFLIRTFGRVHGKTLSAHQSDLIQNFLPKLAPADNGDILEIGFGKGEHLMHLSRKNPNSIIIGAEPFINGVASLLSILKDKDEYANIRIWPDDVRKLLSIFNYQFQVIYILHPDPWPKARHEKRRLMQPEFLEYLSGFLKPGGKIIFGTDHYDLFDWTVEMVKKTNLKIINSDVNIPPEDCMDTRYMQKNKFGSTNPRYLVIGRKE